jgi:hypothetical protein
MRARKRKGFGWKQWSREWLYNELGLFNDYRVRRSGSPESCTSAIGLITLDVKQTGKPSARNGHARFDAAGTENQLTIRLVRHSRRKRGAPDRSHLRSMASVLDPTDVAGNGNQLTVRLVRHSQRKRRATDRSDLRRMAPFLDPTRSEPLRFQIGRSSRYAQGSNVSVTCLVTGKMDFVRWLTRAIRTIRTESLQTR